MGKSVLEVRWTTLDSEQKDVPVNAPVDVQVSMTQVLLEAQTRESSDPLVHFQLFFQELAVSFFLENSYRNHSNKNIFKKSPNIFIFRPRTVGKSSIEHLNF